MLHDRLHFSETGRTLELAAVKCVQGKAVLFVEFIQLIKKAYAF